MNSDVKPENIRVRVDGVFINGNRDEGIKINGEIKYSDFLEAKRIVATTSNLDVA